MELNEIVYHKKRNTIITYLLIILATLGVAFLVMPLILRPMLSNYDTPEINVESQGSFKINTAQFSDDELIDHSSSKITVTLKFKNMPTVTQQQKVKFLSVNTTGSTLSLDKLFWDDVFFIDQPEVLSNPQRLVYSIDLVSPNAQIAFVRSYEPGNYEVNFIFFNSNYKVLVERAFQLVIVNEI